jgi:hypothetical protein
MHATRICHEASGSTIIRPPTSAFLVVGYGSWIFALGWIIYIHYNFEKILYISLDLQDI